jgi:uncharacterized protein YndB with AHSA1/START domain
MPDAATQVEVTRTFDAPRTQVYNAWTDPDQIIQWWGPEHFEVPRDSVDVDVRPGGRFDLTMIDSASGQEYPVRQEIVEATPPELLVMVHQAVPEHGLLEAIETRVEFHEENGGTRVRVTGGPYSAEMGPNAQLGWEQQLDKMVRLLSA